MDNICQDCHIYVTRSEKGDINVHFKVKVTFVYKRGVTVARMWKWSHTISE